MDQRLSFIPASWPAPAHVRAVVTTRAGGASRGPYDSLNLGEHVGDDPVAVRVNRQRVCEALSLPQEPAWLAQVHGTEVIDAARVRSGTPADASYTRERGVVCAVLTADCLPIFLCDRVGTEVALLHAGWRGLAGGIVAAGVRALQTPAPHLIAWLGPAISDRVYEVGDEVRAAFQQRDPGAGAAFRPSLAGRWMIDLYALARRQLQAEGVGGIYGGERCTATEAEIFYSYRRDGTTGRMASLLWLA